MKKIIFTLLLLCAASGNIEAQSMVVAHRGYWNCPGSAQNSLQSLRLADKIGVYGSEFDVHITTDGVLVINHNDEINGIRIDDNPYKAIAGTRLKNGEKLPTLEQYLAEARKHPRLRLILEIKAHNTEAKERRCVDSVLNVVNRMKLLNRINFTSFSMYSCTYLRKKEPSAVILYLGGKLSPAELKAKGLSGMNYSPSEFETHPEWIAQAHKLGLKVGVWTMDNLDLVEKFVKANADYISSNSPEKAKEVVDRLQNK